jgi:hypothetical protein
MEDRKSNIKRCKKYCFCEDMVLSTGLSSKFHLSNYSINFSINFDLELAEMVWEQDFSTRIWAKSSVQTLNVS